MLWNMISRIKMTTPARTSSINIEVSSNSSNSDISNGKNSDEPPPQDSMEQNNDNNNKHGFHNKCESLDEGTFAFMCWMNSENKKSITSDNPIVLLKFVNDKHTILYYMIQICILKWMFR